MEKRKIAVIFQGIGYNADKPLLYYSKKIAMEHGYEVINVGYSGIDKSCLKEKDKILEPDAGTDIVRHAVETELAKGE